MTPFAQGAFARGYSVEMCDPHEYRNHEPTTDSFNLVVIGGGPTRFNGGAERICGHYRRLEVPVVICEFGRLVPGTIMTMVNEKPWVPELNLPVGERAERLGLTYDPKPRGEEILFIGQNREIDGELFKYVAQMPAVTDRKIVFRQHPYRRDPDTWLPDIERSCPPAGVEPGSSECEVSLQEDLDRAWAVVTHSSLVAVTALRRGIPVFAGPSCPAKRACLSMVDLKDIDTVNRPCETCIEFFLRDLAFTIWTDDELRTGQALKFLEGWF
jgi:hypothetical protein